MSRWYKVVFGDITNPLNDEIIIFKEKNKEKAADRALNLGSIRYPLLNMIGIMSFSGPDKPSKNDTSGDIVWDFLNGMN